MMQADTLSTIYTLLADTNLSRAEPSLTTELYEILPSIAVIDPENYLSYSERLESLTRHIEHLLTHAATSKVSIGIGGGFSTGKSRFINTLLNLDILPEAIEPCTAVATYLTYSESDHTQALNIFDSTIDIQQQQLKQLRHFVGDDSENNLHLSQLLKHVTIGSQQIKWQNITFLDTPGYSKADAKNSIVNDESLALTQLSSVDHLVWLISAKNGTIRDEDIKFLHQLDCQTPIFIVVTQADLVNQKDVLPIMRSVQQHLEKNNIVIAGIMAWAAPAYEAEGKLISGDDIKGWLDKLNGDDSDTYLSELIDCCQNLIKISADKIIKVTQDGINHSALLESSASVINDYEAEKLIELLKNEQEKMLAFMNTVVSLIKNNRLFDWDLATLYESNKLKGGITAAIDIYHEQAKNNPDKAIKKLSKIVFNQKNIEAITVLADIYENLLNDIEHSAKYHILLIKSQPNIQQASKSWTWLFNNATTQDSVFNELHDLVTSIGDSEHYYRFALLAEMLSKHELCMRFMLKSAEAFFYDALHYIEAKAKTDNHLKLKLGNIYQKSGAIVNQELAVKIYEELVSDNDQAALMQLKVMADDTESDLAAASLAKMYEHKFHDMNKAASYHIKIVKRSKAMEELDSLQWLFKHAALSENTLYDLYKVTNDLEREQLDYEFAVLANKLNKTEMTTKFMIRAANKNYKPAINYLDKKSKNNPELMLELAAICDKYNTPENKDKSFEIYKKLAIAGNEKALNRLDSLAKVGLSADAMEVLAALYDFRADIDKASRYHLLLIQYHAKSDNVEHSWDWFFKHAENNDKIYNEVSDAVDKSNDINMKYRMMNFLEKLQQHELATEYAEKNIRKNHAESKQWLIKRAKNIVHPAREKLLFLYARCKNVEFGQLDIYPYFIENIMAKDKKAFENLKYMADNNSEYQAMWILSLCYLEGRCTPIDNSEAFIRLKAASKHVKKAKYNYDVFLYRELKKDSPLTYEFHLLMMSLFLDEEEQFFKDCGALKYMFYVSFFEPEFIGFYDEQPSYSINYLSFFSAIFILLLLIF